VFVFAYEWIAYPVVYFKIAEGEYSEDCMLIGPGSEWMRTQTYLNNGKFTGAVELTNQELFSVISTGTTSIGSMLLNEGKGKYLLMFDRSYLSNHYRRCNSQPDNPIVGVADLRITRKERDQFEQVCGINQPSMIAETPKPHEPETGTKKTKLDKQIAAILDAAKCKKYDPLKIPDGGKTEIQAIVSTDPETKSLFAKYSAFESAWKAARNRDLVKMENHDSYAKSNR